jgi:lipid A 3-O-deacylase
VFKLLRILGLGLGLGASVSMAEDVGFRPWEHPAMSAETGLLWEIGTGTPIPYRLVPTQLAWRTRAVFGHEFAGGSHLVLRHRFGLIATWVQHGPESIYAGLTASPSIEWWNRAGTWGLYGGAGGGVGLIDSRGVKGGQGQDFTLNWFMRGGLERMVGKRSSVTAGIMYKHMSNGGQTDPNPGVDALGFSMGFSRYF